MSNPTWPAALSHLADRGSWSFKPKLDAARTDFDAGPARVRRRFTRSQAMADFTVTMSYLETEQFKAFVDYTLRGGTRWFVMPLFQGGAYVDTVVRFTKADEPYQVAEVGYDTNRVSMALETQTSSVALSEGTSWLIDQWGLEFTNEYADLLQVIVNEQYPAIWADWPFTWPIN